MWKDIASIVFVCTTANHMGLIGTAIRMVFRKRKALPVISCPRCLTFWCVLAYGLSGDGFAANPSGLARLLAISFLSAYAAIWLEMTEGLVDRLYDYIYGKIFSAADTADDDKKRAGDTVPGMRRRSRSGKGTATKGNNGEEEGQDRG